jgi:phage shock protein C
MEGTHIPRRLSRTQTGAAIGGVCSGLGLYFDVDPILFRALFIALSFINGVGIVAYLLLWVMIHKKEEFTTSQRQHTHNKIEREADTETKNTWSNSAPTSSQGIGLLSPLLLIAVGFLLLFSSLFSIYMFSFSIVWPLVLIVVGLFLIFKKE